jgi:dihydrofolate reductase
MVINLSVMVAMAQNRVIGHQGKIPWHLPNELQLFKRTTLGHPILMGRKTWESIGRPLPGRTSILITRQAHYVAPGALVTHSLEEALNKTDPQFERFVIGGGELYREALPLADRLYLTTVNAEPEGDTFLPSWPLEAWKKIKEECFSPDERHPYAYRFEVYERKRFP